MSQIQEEKIRSQKKEKQQVQQYPCFNICDFSSINILFNKIIVTTPKLLTSDFIFLNQAGLMKVKYTGTTPHNLGEGLIVYYNRYVLTFKRNIHNIENPIPNLWRIDDSQSDVKIISASLPEGIWKNGDKYYVDMNNIEAFKLVMLNNWESRTKN
jgi:hypothetical protein